MSSNNDFLINGQVAVNIELDRALHLERERTRILQEQQRIKGERKHPLDVAIEIHSELLEQKALLSKDNMEMDAVIEKQKTLLREWMLSQRSFRNLLHKHGKLPDGRSFADLSKEERESIVVSEERHIEQTGDGIPSDNHALRKIIMGK